MRGSEMDDVIFSGNTARPARNHAEVAVSIDNSDRKAPAAFNDTETLEVSRRIMREQGSTFRVNGREVRARDVTVLFADASTGSRSPALVHQGRIGEIIQARPDQRRRVLEEAAGISGLHARRHEAELRLRAAEHNLSRVEDVIGQLAAQVASLKTQAARRCATAIFPAKCAAPRRCCFTCAGSPRRPKSARRSTPGTRPSASSPRAPASRFWPIRARPRSRPPASAPRSRGQGGRGVAAAHHRPRDARARGSPRQRAHRGARPPARAICRRLGARAQTLSRRRSGAAPAGS